MRKNKNAYKVLLTALGSKECAFCKHPPVFWFLYRRERDCLEPLGGRGFIPARCQLCDCYHRVCYCHQRSMDPDQQICLAKVPSFLLPPFPRHHLKSSQPVKLGGAGRLVGEAPAPGLPDISPHTRGRTPVTTQTSLLSLEQMGGGAGPRVLAERGYPGSQSF